MFLLAVGLMCLTACAQKEGGERGPHMGGGMSVNKDSDSTFGLYTTWKDSTRFPYEGWTL